jgi:hypothetical protein
MLKTIMAYLESLKKRIVFFIFCADGQNNFTFVFFVTNQFKFMLIVENVEKTAPAFKLGER